MAAEVQWVHPSTGSSLRFTIRTLTGTMWSTAGTPNFEARTVANWANYVIALTETPSASYFYVGTFPAISGNMVAGFYYLDVYSGTGVIADTLVGTMLGYWNGTTFKPHADDTMAISGTAQTAGRDLATVLPATALNNAPALTDYQQRAVAVTLPAHPPTDFLDANGLKADAVTKVQAGLATQDNVAAPSTGIFATASTFTFSTATNQLTAGIAVQVGPVPQVNFKIELTSGAKSGKIGTVVSITPDPLNFSPCVIQFAEDVTGIAVTDAWKCNNATGAVALELAKLPYLDAAITSRSATGEAAAALAASIADNTGTGVAAKGSAMALTSGERTTLAGAVEAALIDETDGRALLAAIVAKIEATDALLDVAVLASIAAACKTKIEEAGGKLDAVYQVKPAHAPLVDGDGKVTTAGGGGLTAQQTRDAMKLAATAGTPDAGSIDTLIAASKNITVTPGFVGPAAQGSVTTGNFEAFQSSLFTITFPVIDTSGNPVDLSGADLSALFFDPNAANVQTFILTTGGSTIAISGTGHDMVTFTVSPTLNALAKTLDWILYYTTTKRPISQGAYRIKPNPVL